MEILYSDDKTLPWAWLGQDVENTALHFWRLDPLGPG